jgi:hypothetical protein
MSVIKKAEGMIHFQSSECAETLLDMLCYEAYRERLSPEMENLFAGHLAKCECCRLKVLSLKQLLEEQPGKINNLSFLTQPHCFKIS